MKLDLVPRQDWLAMPPRLTNEITGRVKYVFLEYTNTDHAHSKEEGIHLVNRMQDIDIHYHGRADINYNFVIATDGTVFEGRGWGVAAHLKPRDCKQFTPFLLIGLMWNRNVLQKDAPPHMIGVKDDLIQLGKKLKYLHPGAEEIIKYY